ncbi:5-hydroxytryptamine receptor 3A-like [Epinephelus fuscoguttatus]|uniref:5-hydroxytryptamine receptor 3A-like n=1 Tax=Epinephelus fuscoguttatus TaxID=293821 RepID=UPI0020D0F134|nr:5-hydroxytryptamine receptor 3A-like [Epinephelus fuscoguttatus]
MTEVKIVGLIFICFSLLHGFVAALNCTSPTLEALFDGLEKEVFSKKTMRPVKHVSDTLNVSVEMTVEGILGVNEKAQSLTLVIWQVLEWDIAGLSWDEKECGATRISVPREKLWIPDIIIAEFKDEDKSPQTPYVYLYNTGRVYDDRPLRVVSVCRLVIYTFPFDIQNCSLTFGPFLHFAEDIKMIEKLTAAEILEESRQVMQTRGEWELVDIEQAQTTLEITAGSYSEIKYYIILRRRPVLYVINLLLPSCFLIIVDLFSFLLPPHSVDRSSFKMTLILGYTVFLLIMNNLLPTTGNTTPLMNVLFSVSLALMVASLLETVFITNIQFSYSHYRKVPPWLSVFVLQYLAVIVCLPPKKKSNRVTVSLHQPVTAMNTGFISLRDVQSTSGLPVNPPPDPILEELRRLSRDLGAIRHQMDKHFQENSTLQEWQMIALVIDRLLFGLYIVFFMFCFITIVVIWTQSNAYRSPELMNNKLSLGGDLQAICLKGNRQLVGSQSSEEWIQVGFIIDHLLFGLDIFFISVNFITITIMWQQSYSTSGL